MARDPSNMNTQHKTGIPCHTTKDKPIKTHHMWKIKTAGSDIKEAIRRLPDKA
jgi:hypothetical protein